MKAYSFNNETNFPLCPDCGMPLTGIDLDVIVINYCPVCDRTYQDPVDSTLTEKNFSETVDELIGVKAKLCELTVREKHLKGKLMDELKQLKLIQRGDVKIEYRHYTSLRLRLADVSDWICTHLGQDVLNEIEASCGVEREQKNVVVTLGRKLKKECEQRAEMFAG